MGGEAVHIECPSCSENNEIDFGNNVLCCKCGGSFAGHAYKKIKNNVMSTVGVLFIGAYGAYKVDQVIFEGNRYPVSVEYEILDGCVNSSGLPMPYGQKVYKTQVCICAIDKTMAVVSYKEMQKNEPEFLARFRNYVTICQ